MASQLGLPHSLLKIENSFLVYGVGTCKKSASVMQELTLGGEWDILMRFLSERSHEACPNAWEMRLAGLKS